MKDKGNVYLAVSIILVIALQNIHYTRFLMYPFNLFATWVHEMGHGLMASATGGEFLKLVINSDTSGYAQYYPPRSSFAQILVTSAGYMGTSLFGAMMLLFRKVDKFVLFFCLVLGVIMGLSLIVYTRSLTGWLFGVPFTALLIFTGIIKSEFNKFFYTFLASQIALNAILDINVLFSVNSMNMNGMQMSSDAAKMSDLLLFPSWFWAGFWMILSVILFVGALWKPVELKKGNQPVSRV